MSNIAAKTLASISMTYYVSISVSLLLQGMLAQLKEMDKAAQWKKKNKHTFTILFLYISLCKCECLTTVAVKQLVI